jgi:phospholipase/carboxylesterase
LRVLADCAKHEPLRDIMSAHGTILLLMALLAGFACRRVAVSTDPVSDAGMDVATSWAGLNIRTVGERKHPRQVVVLLHGWGAPGDDLVPLAAHLAAPGRLFVFPAAPLAGPAGGRAWWHLDFEALLAARASGRDRELRAQTPEGLAEARTQILALLVDIERQTQLPRTAMIVGGFSQGAMLAIDVALASNPRPKAIIALSGTLLSEARWTAELAEGKPVPLFLSHGRQDPVLPFRLASALHELVSASGNPVTWVPFEGGHEIPPEVLAGVATFLATI